MWCRPLLLSLGAALVCLSALELQIEPPPAADPHDRHADIGTAPRHDPRPLAPPPDRALHERIAVLAAGGWRLGPFAWLGQEVVIELRERPAEAGGGFSAQWSTPSRAAEPLPVQTLFRRVVVGPIGSEALGAGGAPWPTWYWVLIREGDLRVVTQQAEPRYFDDEWDFSVAFRDLDLAGRSAAEVAELKDAFWAREAALWEQAPAASDDPER